MQMTKLKYYISGKQRCLKCILLPLFCVLKNLRTKPQRLKPALFYAFVPLILCTSVCTVKAADNKSGVSPQTISLPSGPGSIEGMGESFEPQMNTGTAAYPVKLTVAPGRNGHQPSVTLSYNSGGGNSPYGLGWNLSTTAIQRQTDKGQPKYNETDTFVYSNGEELVPLADGTYALRNAGSFFRFRRTGDSWEAWDKSGMRYRFGMYPDDVSVRRSRLGKGDLGFHNTFKWLLDELVDTNGNVIKYYYIGYDDSPGQLYLSEIRYNFSGNLYNAVVFRYETRSDGFADYRSGLKIKTGRRVSSIEILSMGQLVREYRLKYDYEAGDLLHSHSVQPIPVKISTLKKIIQYDRKSVNYLPPLRFEYTGLYTQDVDYPPTGNFPGLEDIDLNGNGIQDSSGIQKMHNVPSNVTFQDGNSEFIDLNGDALPDILHTLPGQHLYYQNLGNGHFAAGKTMRNAPFVQLSSDTSVLADLDGDSRTDLVTANSPSKWVFYRNLGNGNWAPGLVDNTPPQFLFNAGDTRLMDIDFDKKIDVVRSNDNGTWSYCLSEKGEDTDHLPYGNFPGTEDLDLNGDGVLDAGAWECVGSVSVDLWGGINFQNPAVKLADMNGDRLQDMVWIRQNQDQVRIGYWPGKGLAQFSDYQAISPDLVVGPVDAKDLKLLDVNGDGLADLIHVRPGQVTVWFNLADSNWSDAQRYEQMVFYNPATTSLRYADMNGNGTTDLVWIQAVPATPNERIQYFDFSGKTKANQLKIVDNGLGRRINIQYKSTTDYMVEAREAGNPWNDFSPLAMQLVSKVTVQSGLDLDSVAGSDQNTIEYNYRDPYYDPYQKEFRGFSFVKKIERGDSTAPTLVTRNFYHTGAPDDVDNDGDGALDERGFENETEEQALKGQILKQEITTALGGADHANYDGMAAPDVTVIQRIANSWSINRIHNIEGGSQQMPTMRDEEVSFSLITQTDSFLIEQTKGTPKQLRKTFRYDNWGNLLEEKNYGELNLPGDEVFATNEYAENVQLGIRDKVKYTLQTDGYGVKAAESFFYYDGADYVGMPLGMVNRGNVTRKQVWKSGSEYIDVERKAFDSYGNVTGIMDGKGNLRTIGYDTLLNTFPVKETIHLGDGKEPLEVSVQYDYGIGKIIQSTDYNGHDTFYNYDSFGRAVNIIQPGDSWTYPTQSFSYHIVDPHRALAYVYDAEGTLDLQYTTGKVSSVQTRTREKSGLSGTLDSWKFTDGLGRELGEMEEDDSGFVIKNTTRFNARGSVQYVFQPYRVSTAAFQAPTMLQTYSEKKYDASGRELLTIFPPDKDGVRHQVETKYHPLHKSVIDENGHPKDTFSDGLERILSVNEHNLGETYITRYQYDPLGNLLQITDAQNNVKTLEYDGLGRKTYMNDPDNGETYYTYDDAGNLVHKKDNKGQEIAYGYDGANRILSEDFLEVLDSRKEVIYHYDQPGSDYGTAENLKGQLAWIEDPSGAVFFSYDARSNPIWQVKRIVDGNKVDDYQTYWNYDAMARVTSVIWPDGESVRYQYNNRGLLSGIPGIVDAVTYHETGQLLSIDYHNGVKTDYDYDPRNRLIELKSRTQGQLEYFQNLGYQFDGKGNIKQIADHRTIDVTAPNHAGQSFGYDHLDRLTSANGVYGNINYRYDAIGNMTRKESPESGMTGHVNDVLINLGTLRYGGTSGSANRTGKGDDPGPHAVTSTESGLLYDYDANGNMILHAEGDVYQWDYSNRLLEVQKGSSNSKYVYDHSGQRVIKTVTDATSDKKAYYISKEYEIRDDKVYKYVFIGSNRAARIETPLSRGQAGVEQQLIELKKGWNFISLKLQPADNQVESVFQSILPAVETIYTYDNEQQKYLKFVPGYNHDLITIQPYQGCIVKVKYGTTLVVEGLVDGSPINMKAGWNLKGLPIEGMQPPAAALAAINGHYTSVWSYNNESTSWTQAFADPALPAGLNTLTQFNENKSYWINLNTDAQVTNKSGLNGTVVFYHPDHLGSTSLTTNQQGEVISETAYYPFGRPRFQQDADGNGTFYKYTGKELDSTGLFYYEARYMDPVIGRFVSVDPLMVESPEKCGIQECNLYSYTTNNPIIFIDPTGTFLNQALQAKLLAETGASIGGGTTVTVATPVIFAMSLAYGGWYLKAKYFPDPPIGPHGHDAGDDSLGWFIDEPEPVLEASASGAGALKGGGGVGIPFYHSVFSKNSNDLTSTFGNVQRHHLIPWGNSTYPHYKHPLVKDAGVDIRVDPNNLMYLGNHAGPHSKAYHAAVKNLLNQAYSRVAGQGVDAARNALQGVYQDIAGGIIDGSIKPYNNKEVYPQ